MAERKVNLDKLHCDQHPHWSESVDWRPGRWDPLDNAPSEGSPILNVRGRLADGTIVEPMHRACGDGDGLMPPFNGWFVPCKTLFGPTVGDGFHEVSPVEWQPLRAAPTVTETPNAKNPTPATNDQ